MGNILLYMISRIKFQISITESHVNTPVCGDDPYNMVTSHTFTIDLPISVSHCGGVQLLVA